MRCYYTTKSSRNHQVHAFLWNHAYEREEKLSCERKKKQMIRENWNTVKENKGEKGRKIGLISWQKRSKLSHHITFNCCVINSGFFFSWVWLRLLKDRSWFSVSCCSRGVAWLLYHKIWIFWRIKTDIENKNNNFWKRKKKLLLD